MMRRESDSNSDMGLLSGRLIQTNVRIGLNMAHAIAAIKLLRLV